MCSRSEVSHIRKFNSDSHWSIKNIHSICRLLARQRNLTDNILQHKNYVLPLYSIKNKN